MSRISRRRLVSGALAAGGFGLAGKAALAQELPVTPHCGDEGVKTLAQTEGPFFRAGSPGRDDLFGDGAADAFAAVMSIAADGATPVAAAAGTTKREDAGTPRGEPGIRAIAQPSLSSTGDKSTVSQADSAAPR